MVPIILIIGLFGWGGEKEQSLGQRQGWSRGVLLSLFLRGHRGPRRRRSGLFEWGRGSGVGREDFGDVVLP